jgi:acyl-CoA thioester hydrolase
MTGDPFSIVQRVRFGDLDAMGHMNNVQFLRFFETARIEYMKSHAPEREPDRKSKDGFVIAECHINYRAPAFYDDDIRTWVRPGERGRSSMRLDFEMRRQGDDELIADGWGTLVAFDYEAGRSRPWPGG